MNLNSLSISKNDFIKEELIGKGAFADVYKGKWEYSDKPVAIKVWCMRSLPQHLAAEYELAGTFLNHPNLLTTYGVCLEPGKFCDVMELMDISLNQLQRDLAKVNGKLSLRNISHIASGIVNGVTYLHSKSKVYKHLKSHNVLLSKDLSVVKIADAGRSRLKLEMSSCIQNRLQQATVRYRAPETCTREFARMKDNLDANQKADVYAIGMLIWELNAGHEPYEQDTEMSVVNKLIMGIRETIPDNCFKPYALLIQKCWNNNSNERPSALEIKAELKKIDAVIEACVEKTNVISNGLFSQGQMSDIYKQTLMPYLAKVTFSDLFFKQPIESAAPMA
jgi:serine/threonine protein kinase